VTAADSASNRVPRVMSPDWSRTKRGHGLAVDIDDCGLIADTECSRTVTVPGRGCGRGHGLTAGWTRARTDQRRVRRIGL